MRREKDVFAHPYLAADLAQANKLEGVGLTWDTSAWNSCYLQDVQTVGDIRDLIKGVQWSFRSDAGTDRFKADTNRTMHDTS